MQQCLESMAEDEMDENIYNLMPDILRWDDFGFSMLDSSPMTVMVSGSFGSGFNDQGWNRAYEWLADQDTDENLLGSSGIRLLVGLWFPST